MNISGKTALVTGGASGLGAATARMLHQAGARVVILDVNDEGGQALAAELGHDAVRFAKTDVADPAQAESAVRNAVAWFGGVHIAVNCAGIGDPQKIVGKDGPASLDRFARVIRV